MEFGILGPVEARSDGAVVPLGGRVPTTVLAVLLLDAGRVVASRRMVEAVWADDPPATARRQLQNTVAHLRRRLGADLIERVGDGHRLVLGESALDSDEFAKLVRGSRSSDVDPADALASLRKALGLWRGRPLSNASGPAIRAAASRLWESRLGAIEDRMALEVELGRSTAVIDELRDLLVEYPHRQRIAVLLMRALHRCGRRSEALGVYETARARLADELGLDPGRELRECHRDILRARPAPDIGGRVPLGRIVPAQLPSDSAGFVGRQEPLRAIDAALDDRGSPRHFVIAGPAGSGKTALAVHWAHRVRDRFGDGQLYINLRGFDRREPVTPVEALRRLIRALGGPDARPSASLADLAATYRALVEGKRLLVVIDNARDIEQVRPLLPLDDNGFAVVTSRLGLRGLATEGDPPATELAPLRRAEAMRLLSAFIGDERIRDARPAARRLAGLCGDLPLALRIAGAQLAIRPELAVADLVEELSSRDRLDALSIDGDPDAAVGTALGHSDRALEADSRDLWYRLGLLPGDDFDAGLAAAVGSTTAPTIEEPLRLLLANHLIEQHRPGRYRFHDLTREYARGRAHESFDDTELLAIQAEAMTWFHANRYRLSPEDADHVLVACRVWSDHPQMWRLAYLLIDAPAVGRLPHRQRYLMDLGIRSARRDGSPAARQVMYGIQAMRHQYDNDIDAAIRAGAKSLEVAEDPDGTFHFYQAVRLRITGDHDGAGELLQASHDQASREGDEFLLFACERGLGNSHRLMGRFARAEPMLLRAKERAEALDASTTDGHLTRYLAYLRLTDLYIDLGDTRSAWDNLRRMLSIIDGLPRHDHPRVLLCHGRILQLDGEFSRAEAKFREALEIAEEHDAGDRIVECHVAIAHTLCDMGEPERALRQLARAEQPTMTTMVTASRCLATARVQLALGRADHARDAAVAATESYMSANSPLWQARALEVLADAHDALGQPEAARRHRERSGRIFAGIGVANQPSRAKMPLG